MIIHSFKKREKKVLPVISIGNVWVSRPILLQPVWSSYRTHSKELAKLRTSCTRNWDAVLHSRIQSPSQDPLLWDWNITNWWTSLLVEHQLMSGCLQTLYSSGCININGLKCFLMLARTGCSSWPDIRKTWMLRNERKVYEVRTIPQATSQKA